MSRTGRWQIRKMQPWEQQIPLCLYGSCEQPWQLWWVDRKRISFMGARSSFELIVQAMLRKEETWPQ